MFLNWAAEEVIFGSWATGRSFLHGSWIISRSTCTEAILIDRAGYKKFKEIMLEGVKLNPECLVAEDIFWSEAECRQISM